MNNNKLCIQVKSASNIFTNYSTDIHVQCSIWYLPIDLFFSGIAQIKDKKQNICMLKKIFLKSRIYYCI